MFFLLTLLLVVIDWSLIKEPFIWVSMAFWGICICSFPLVIYKEIVLVDKIYVKRYLIKPWIIPYQGIKDITDSTVKLKRFHLVLREMQNSLEFTDILFDQLGKRNQLNQIENELWKEEENGNMSALIGICMGTSVSFLFGLVFGESIPISFLILSIVIVVTISVGFYHFNKKYYTSKSALDSEPDYDRLNKKMNRDMSLLFSSITSGSLIYLISKFDIDFVFIHPKSFFIILWIGAFLSTFFLSMLYFKKSKI
ncbi:MAG: hypothetical protein ACMZ7B_08465 [Balneola sp.]